MSSDIEEISPVSASSFHEDAEAKKARIQEIERKRHRALIESQRQYLDQNLRMIFGLSKSIAKTN